MKSGARSEGLRRGLEILRLFTDTDFEWGITEISTELGLHKSRVHRAVKTLEDVGFLRKNLKNRKYLLGLHAFELGSVASRRFNLIPEARPLMKKLAAKTKATVSIRIKDGDDMVVVECIESPDDLRVHSPQGARRPWDFGAGGKVFLAHLPPEQVKRMIGEYGLTRYTERSITVAAEYLDDLKRVRERGYAISDGEHILGALSIAAPIHGTGGEVIAVLMVAVPTAGMADSKRLEFERLVVESADSLSCMMTNGVAAGRS